MKHLYILAALCCSLAASGQFQDALQEICEDHELMGASIVTICDGEIDHVFHYGLSDYTREIEVNDNTMYRIASISKAITATGFMLLYDDGLFSFDDDISDHLGYEVHNPNYPDSPITIEMVLSHQSSLQDGDGYSGFLSATYADPPPSISHVLLENGNYYTSNMWRTEEPGTYFAYSNINFGLAATLMEAISGQRFDIFMKENLFEPMGLVGSYNVADIEDIDNLAVLYRNQGGWNPQVDNYQGEQPVQPSLEGYIPGGNGARFAPQGGLRMSAIELAKLAQLHMNGGEWNGEQLIQSSTIELMHTPLWSDNGSNGDDYYNLFNQWGLGIQSTTNAELGDIVVDGKTMYGHPGEAYGLISDWYFEKDDRSAIIFLTNGAWDGFSWGNYSAFYTLEEDIFSAYADMAYDICSVNIPEQDQPSFEVFPNPAQGQMTLRLSSDHNNVQVALIDALGREVLNLKSRGVDTLHLPVSDLPRGTYTLQVRGEDYSWNESVLLR